MKYSNFKLTVKIEISANITDKYKATVVETSWLGRSKTREVYSEGGDRWVFTDTGKKVNLDDAITQYEVKEKKILHEIDVATLALFGPF